MTCLLIGCAGVPAARAQAGLEITARNTQTGAPVPGVTVHVENPAIGYAVARTTDAQGRVQLAGLSTSGAYTIFFEENDAYYAARASDISLRANHTRSVTLLMNPLAAFELEEVVVEERTSVAEVNKVNAEVASSLSAQEVEALPVEGRNFTQVLYRLPNVSRATGFYPEAPNVSINGANGLYTNYLIDGMDNNENFLGGPQFEVPTGVVKDITVLASTYSAEFGRTGNGIINVTTKSGGNEVTGEGYYLTRPGQPLDGNTTFPQRDLSGNQVKSGFERHQGGIAIGGPIVTDQTFYFVDVEHTTDWKDNVLNVPQLGLTSTVPGNNHFTYGSAKIDHRWNEAWRSSLRANVNRVRIERQGGGLTGGVQFPSAANTQQRDGVHVALQNTYAGTRLVYESNLQYSRFRWDYADTAHPDRPQVTVLDPQEQALAVLDHPGFAFDDLENTFQLQQKLTYRLGNHTLKGGIDLLTSDFSLEGGGNPNGNYTVKLNADQRDALRSRDLSADLTATELTTLPGDIEVLNYAVELRPNAFGVRQNQLAAYVEDQFSPMSSLTLTAGLRYDFDSLTEGGGSTADADYNNLAPRLSANYALGERSSLRAGYGIFYDKIVYSIYSDALQQNTTSAAYRAQIQSLVDQGLLPADTDVREVTFDGNLTGSFAEVPFLDGPTPAEAQNARGEVFSNERRILNPNGYDNPETHQFSVGYQRQVGARTRFYVDLIHTRSYNLFRLRDLNAPAPHEITRAEVDAAQADPNRDPSDLVRSRFEADQTRPTDLFQRDAEGNILFDANGNPQYTPGVARQVVMTETAGEARYWAATLNLMKERGPDDYAYRLSYTLSRLRNNTDDINFRAEDANNFEEEWGPSVNDRTHVINGTFTYVPAEGLSVTVAALVQSGQPINRIPDATVFGTTDLNGDGRSFGAAYVGNSDRSPGASRNSDRLPWSSTFDLSAQYTLPVADGRVAIRADVFNVTNAQNWSGFANNATQSNQIQVGPESNGITRKNAGPPRQFQFGVRYEF